MYDEGEKRSFDCHSLASPSEAFFDHRNEVKVVAKEGHSLVIQLSFDCHSIVRIGYKSVFLR